MGIPAAGIDLAKNVFALHGVNEGGRTELLQPRVPRAKLHALVASLPSCTLGIEARSGAHHRRAPRLDMRGAPRLAGQRPLDGSVGHHRFARAFAGHTRSAQCLAACVKSLSVVRSIRSCRMASCASNASMVPIWTPA